MFPRRSLQSHFIGIILGITLVLTGIMGLLNLRSINIYSTWVANTGLNWETEKTAADLNKPLLQSMDAVNFMAATMRQFYTDLGPGQIQDYRRLQTVNQRLCRRFEAVVETIPEINGFYIHYNETLTGRPDGFWYRKEPGATGYQEGPIMDVGQALARGEGPTDWYTQPRDQQHAMWLPPYRTVQTGTWVVSYVKPVYVNHRFIGVVGIDINLSTLISLVHQVSIYESGYAFLVSPEGQVYVHPDTNILTDQDATIESLGLQVEKAQLRRHDTGDRTIPVTYKGKKRQIAFTTLENGMKMGVSAPNEEIYAVQRQAIFRMIFLIILFGIATSAIAIALARRVLAPLRDIDLAAQRMGRGDYNTPVVKQRDDEIGRLADNMNATMGQMKGLVRELRSQAQQDKLTGVKNTTAFDEKMLQLDRQILAGTCPPFSLVMVDMNGLKQINDTYGHEKGNLAIQAMVKTICDLYKHSPVYRIGGDEFVVLVQNDDYASQDIIWRQLVPYLHQRSQGLKEPWLELSFSAGRAQYQPGIDEDLKAVFRRADAAMYKVKRQIEGKGIR
ncbi:diguanylate cyclase [Acidaminococcus timonensis]|uniref:sensor domain-containing diguanylate cyclase n=1 Tax=Acidaminococcus timonensis TaxID=1871002 RepID=UPI0025F47921|nr:diguanylate cyclase [Acidaminococcus timonensis]